VNHHANPKFWAAYDQLSETTQRSADKSFALLRENPLHPSLHFKQVGRYWSARIGLDHRALALRSGDEVIWFWIGTHAEYDRLIS
jgi:hypothetical protein